MKLRFGKILLALLVCFGMYSTPARANWLDDLLNEIRNTIGQNLPGDQSWLDQYLQNLANEVNSRTAPEWSPSTRPFLPATGWALGFAGGVAALIVTRRRAAAKRSDRK